MLGCRRRAAASHLSCNTHSSSSAAPPRVAASTCATRTRPNRNLSSPGSRSSCSLYGHLHTEAHNPATLPTAPRQATNGCRFEVPPPLCNSYAKVPN